VREQLIDSWWGGGYASLASEVTMLSWLSWFQSPVPAWGAASTRGSVTGVVDCRDDGGLPHLSCRYPQHEVEKSLS
jgi:hypothetical protein